MKALRPYSILNYSQLHLLHIHTAVNLDDLS